MKALLTLFAASFVTVASYGQGQVVFANRVTGVFDAPVILTGDPRGPGPDYSAQLLLQGANGSLTPLLPTTTFRPSGIGAAAVADRYWFPVTLDVPGVPSGANATFVVR